MGVCRESIPWRKSCGREMQNHMWSNVQVKVDPDTLHSLAASATVYANALARLRASTKDLDGGDKCPLELLASGEVRTKGLGSVHHAKGT